MVPFEVTCPQDMLFGIGSAELFNFSDMMREVSSCFWSL
jgi:hypothetical protein